MKLWIDARRISAELVFGMSLVERHIKAVCHQNISFSEIIIDIGTGTTPSLPEETALKCPLSIASGEGNCTDRLKSALMLGEPLIVTDATTLIDARLYSYLAQRSSSCAIIKDRAVIAYLNPTDVDLLLPASNLASATAQLPQIQQEDFPSFVAKLRRSLPFYLFQIDTSAERKNIEKFLFWSNYKGSTDFFTKYIYPPIVWAMVPILARAKIHPNTITAFSIFLTFIAVPLFAMGHFWWGFACAYSMSVLDSVDGKLARLTFTDSAIGNVLDHGLDIIHPPFWYFSWAIGILGGWSAADLNHPLWLAGCWMMAFYILDRLILSVYRAKFKRGLHTHSAMDGFVRTFISRRNINLPFFTLSYAIGWEVEAFYFIVFWQVLTCIYHAGRTIWILMIDRPEVPNRI